MPSPTPQLMRVPGASLHRQLYLVLRDGIINETWPAGSALPTEEALRAQFDVSRATVRRALADLAANGLVERRHGSGTYVNGRLAEPRPPATLDMVEGLRQSHSETQVRVIGVVREVPPQNIAALLQLATGEEAVHALRLRHISGTPVMLTDAWVPERLGSKVTAAALRRRALYELLLDQQVVFGRVVQEISAEAAGPQRARLLQTEVGAPLIKFIRLLHDQEGRSVHYLTAYMLPERSRILMHVPAEAMNTLAAGQFVHDGVKPLRPAGRARK